MRIQIYENLSFREKELLKVSKSVKQSFSVGTSVIYFRVSAVGKAAEEGSAVCWYIRHTKWLLCRESTAVPCWSPVLLLWTLFPFPDSSWPDQLSGFCIVFLRPNRAMWTVSSSCVAFIKSNSILWYKWKEIEEEEETYKTKQKTTSLQCSICFG